MGRSTSTTAVFLTLGLLRVLIVSSFIGLVGVATATEEEFATSCLSSSCTPPCPDVDASNCSTPNRPVPRPSADCPCCVVCALQTGETCDVEDPTRTTTTTTARAKTCDSQLGLSCDNATETCQGPFGLRATLITHNSTILHRTNDDDHGGLQNIRRPDGPISVKFARHLEELDNETDWKSAVAEVDARDDAISVGGLTPNEMFFVRVSDAAGRHEIVIVNTKVGCIENGTSYAVGQVYEVGCHLLCECSDDGRAKCEDRCPSQDSSRNCRLLGPDPNDACCSRFSCDGDSPSSSSLSSKNSHGDDMARVLLTSRSPDSLTIAWDDFKIPGPNFEFGYVVEYRPNSSSSDGPWTRIQVGNVPITTIRNLHPNTAYDVRVFVWEDVGWKRMSTEVVILHTEDGCVWRNQTVSVGNSYNQDCDARCHCVGNDTSECSDRCVEPLRPASITATSGEPLSGNCTMSPVRDDHCCVLVDCGTDPSPSGKHLVSTTRQDHVEETRIFECPTSVPDVGGDCRSTCKSDLDCASHRQKCCLTFCGSTTCTPPLPISGGPETSNSSMSMGRHSILDQCSGRTCGRNAICQHRSTPLEQCRCLPGFSGDPNGFGCNPDALKTPTKGVCSFGRDTYVVGETHVQGCEYKCRCHNNSGVYEMLCQPRCPQREDKHRLLDPACRLLPDPSDHCCKILVCENETENDARGDRERPKDSWITMDDDDDSESTAASSINATSALGTNTSATAEANNTVIIDGGDIASLNEFLSNSTGTQFIRTDPSSSNATIVLDDDIEDDERNASSVMSNSNSTSTQDNSTSTQSNSTSFQLASFEKDVRRLQDATSSTPSSVSAFQTSQQPADVATASIQQILPIGPTNVRLQIAMSPHIMEMLFVDTEGVSVIYTNNLTSDLLLWDRHPLIVRHNVAFVTVDRSDVAVETVVSDLEPNREYYFAVVIVRQKAEKDGGGTGERKLEYQRLGGVEATVTVQLEEGMCEFMGKTFGPGERLYDDCQAVCDCLPGQRVRCEALVCPGQLGPERSGCLEWQVDATFIARAPHCCPDVPCMYSSTCLYGGRKFRNLETIPRDLVPECDKDCKCVAGNVTCSQRCPTIDVDNAPTDMNCEHPVIVPVPGDVLGCCKRWICESDDHRKEPTTPSLSATTTTDRAVTTVGSLLVESTTQDANRTNNTGFVTVANDTTSGEIPTVTNTTATTTDVPILQQLECIYENQTYRVNEQWKVGRGHRQKSCSCVAQIEGTTLAECQGGCPPILTHHLSLIPDCPPGNVVIWDVPELCPYVVCNKTDAGRGVKNVTAVPLNATSMRIDFVIPSIYVGLYGHAEILYTMDLMHSDDTTTWSKEVFSGPSNQFEGARLTHEMNGMQPDTEYYLKVQVVIKNTKNVDSSDVITVRTLPLPTTTTTTTTTTLPPKISLDARLEVSDVQPTSAKVSWRAFKSSERRFVDGVQLQYRIRSQEDHAAAINSPDIAAAVAEPAGPEPLGQWSLTTLIHRDVTSYLLTDLKPDSDYDVDLIFVPPANISTEVLSMNPTGFRTMLVHDDFEFNLTLTVDKVTSQSVELIFTGVPYPEHKYVNVYRILYLAADILPSSSRRIGEEPAYMYKPPKGNQFQFTVDGLVPSTNYTVWMEAYLINGRTRTSNNITVLTKLGPSTSKITEKEKHESLGGAKGLGGQIEGEVGEDYVAALIVVAVIAALVTLGFVILLVILLRKQSSAKAPITTGSASPAVKSHSAYDNPTYKDSLD